MAKHVINPAPGRNTVWHFKRAQYVPGDTVEIADDLVAPLTERGIIGKPLEVEVSKVPQVEEGKIPGAMPAGEAPVVAERGQKKRGRNTRSLG